MSRSALVVGGTGPTGPHVISGLRDRGFEVTILHRGNHELAELDAFEHLHADPHFRESIVDVLGGRRFDVVLATYGRLKHVADALSGRCDQFVAVGGLPVYPGYHEPGATDPRGMPISAGEEASDVRRPVPAVDSGGERFSRLIHESEHHVLRLHAAGAFSASIFRYPSIYGPRQLYPREWSIVRRVLDGRRTIIVPDAGLTVMTRCAALNAANFLLAAIDAPDRAAGEVFNAGDVQQYDLSQWIEMTSIAAGVELEQLTLPWELAGPGRDLFPVPHTAHTLVSIRKAIDLLGYREVVSASQALREAVRWFIEHPPDEVTLDRMVDKFDYAEEDRITEMYRSATAQLREAQTMALAAAHPYPHPRQAGGQDHRAR